jgi:MATE family multidrug resistance protein
MSDVRDDKPLMGIGEVVRLSWPSGLSMLNSTLMRFLDGLLVSFLGTVPFSAQLVAGLASFVPESFATGLLIVVNTYVAQNLGAKLYDRCGKYARAGMAIALAFCLLIFPLIFFARPIFNTFNAPQVKQQQAAIQSALTKFDTQFPSARSEVETTSPHAGKMPATHEGGTPSSLATARAELATTYELIDLEVMYFRYMVIAVFVTLTARPLEQFFFGVHRPRVVLAASLVANAVNLALAYLLVFGQAGLEVLDHKLGTGLAHSALGRLNIPKFGLEGAAWANLSSWGLYMALLAAMFLSRKIDAQYLTRRIRIELREIRDILRIGWPAGVQFLNDVLPWTLMLAWLVNRFGPDELAATTVAMRWMPLSFMPAVGIGVATTALVGRYLGQRQPHLARRRTHAAVLLALAYMGICGLVFLIFRHELVKLFITIEPSPDAAAHAATILDIGGKVMICAAVFQLSDAVGIVFMGGLRGAGDTFWPMILTLLLSWGLIIGGGYLMVTERPQWGSIGPWIAGSVYLVALGIALAWRFERGRWRNIDLLHRS